MARKDVRLREASARRSSPHYGGCHVSVRLTTPAGRIIPRFVTGLVTGKFVLRAFCGNP